jgi:pilus assembly protein Flp/PilA
MKKLLAFREAYLRDEDGATAIEYGLIAAGISLAIVTVVFTFGQELLAMFTTMEGKLAQANADAAEDPAP